MRKLSLAKAQAQYVHRYTMEHKPTWAELPHNGRYCAPQYRSDQEWYDHTLFPGERGHPFPGEDSCYSTGATWPMGTWLDKPYYVPQRHPHYTD